MPIHQFINLLGTQTPFYGICAGLGLLVIGLRMIIGFREFSLDGKRENELLYGFPFMVIVGAIFAFLLDAVFTGDWQTWTNSDVRQFGFTYMGWVFGIILFLLIYGRHTSFGPRFFLNFYLPSLALAQAIGRIGCFLGGCCYGRPCPWGVHYPEGSFPFEQVGDVGLMPIQLFESEALILLTLFCLRTKFRYKAIAYLFGLSVIRFVCEFFRGDQRGDFFGITILSPQQFMSIGFFLFAIVLCVLEHKSPTSPHACSAQEMAAENA